MKPKLFLFLVLLSVPWWLSSTLWEIKQDGTGNFTTIQEGIDASVNSDTVLVYPGTYYENLIMTNNNGIALGSLYLTTGDESYIAQTILDGNQSSSVIRIEDITSPYFELRIVGFVIQHGIGYQYGTDQDRAGGGLFVSESSINLEKCIIQYNNVNHLGGGVVLSNSYLHLSGSSIRHNSAFNAAGGILIGNISSSVYFDNENLNSIYLNYAGIGNEIYKTDGSPFQEIIVDTFTVSDPAEGYYFIYPGSGGAGVPLANQFSFNCQNAVIEQVNYDLYVSPNGDDTNSGISVNDPLKTIAFALVKIRSDSLSQKTIHISDGDYSVSQNDQIFPLHIKSYVNIIGETRENTILNAEYMGGFFSGNDPQQNYEIANFSLINAFDKNEIHLNQNTNVIFDNIQIINHTNSTNEYFPACRLNFSDVKMNNIIFEDNQYTSGIQFYSPKHGYEFNISNSIFKNNEPSNLACSQMYYDFHTIHFDSLTVNTINIEMSENLSISNDWPPNVSAILINSGTKFNLINSTIVNNRTIDLGAAIKLADETIINVVNSILYGNLPYQICLNGTWGPNTLNANNSLIEDGLLGILNMGNNYINWDETTMLDEDPLWLGGGYEWPYALAADSPCIDTGTLELPFGVELPAYDLAGNPRVMGSNIDMGAYEFPGNAAPIYLEMYNETLSWQMPAGFSPTAYNVYLDDELLSSVSPFLNEFTFNDLYIGDLYKAGVSALYSTEETAVIPHYFTYNPVGIEEEIINPSSLIHNLSNYPNPFNPETVISYNLLESGKVNLSIYNIKGQKVKQLINAQLSSGSYSVSWYGKDTTNKRVSSGEYFAKLKINGEEVAVNKMLLLK